MDKEIISSNGRVSITKSGGRLLLGVVIGILCLAAFGFGDLALSGALSPGTQPVADIPLLTVNSTNLTVAIVPLVPSPEVEDSLSGDDLPSDVTAGKLVDDEGLAELSTSLTEVYGFNVVVREPLTIPDEYFNAERGQYVADDLVDWLMEQTDPHHFKTIGVVAQDIFKHEYNFLYGLAKIAGSACVASSHRMGSFVLLPKLTPAERWGSLVAHELGHTLGLIHVENKKSIMQYGDCLDALDKTGTNLVDDDRRRLEQLWTIKWHWN